MKRRAAVVGLALSLLMLAVLALAEMAQAAQPPKPSSSPAAAPASCFTGTWQPQARYPIPIYDQAMAAQGGLIYSFGGDDGNNAVARAYRYDPATNVWTRIADLPAVRERARAVSDGTYLYILGGATTGGYSNVLLRNDPVANAYTTLAPYVTATEDHAVAYLNGKIYRIAGSIYQGYTNTVEAYTIASNTWATVASYPVAATMLLAIANGGYIYAGGGTNGPVLNKTYRYDPAANAWDDATIADLPTGRFQFSGDLLDGRWVVAGGLEGSLTTSADAWDPTTNTWTALPDMLQASALTGGATVGRALYIVGGIVSGGQPSTGNQQYREAPCASPTPTVTGTPPTATVTATPTNTPTPATTPCRTGAWSEQAPYPTPVAAALVAAQGGLIYSFGGGDANANPFTASNRYDPAANTWTAIAPLPTGRFEGAAVSDGTYIYLLGGASTASHPTNTLWRYDPATDTYITLESYYIPTDLHAAAYLNGKIYRIGGCLDNRECPSNFSGATSSVEVYTISTNSWTSATSLPVATSGLFATAFGGYVYVAGGTPLSGGVHNTYRYDPASDTWDDAAIAEMPQWLTTGVAGWVNGRWIVAGDDGNGTGVLAWDPGQNTWGTLPNILTYTLDPGGAATGSALYYIGGIPNPAMTGNQQYVEVACGLPTATSTNTPTNTPMNSPTPTPTACSVGGWSLQAPYPTPVSSALVAAQGGMMYSFGGVQTGSTPLTSAYRYDPLTNTWTQIAPLPASRAGGAAISDGAYIYLLGGLTANQAVTNSLWRYDPATDTYTTLAPYLTPTLYHAVTYMNGKVYRIGGCTTYGCFGYETTTVEVYTISTNSWSSVAPLPIATFLMMATTLNGYVYVAGGIPHTLDATKTYRYDPATDTWDDAAIAEMPFPLVDGVSGLLNGRWIVAGDQGGRYPGVFAWDPSQDTWTTLPDRLQLVDFSGGAVIGAALYGVGGLDTANQPTTYNQRYLEVPCATPTATVTNTPTPAPTDTPTPSPTPCQVGAWSLQTPYPTAIIDPAVVEQGNYIYSFGGAGTSQQAQANAYRYDPAANQWTILAPLPAARAGARAVSDGSAIYLLGGYDTSHAATNTLWRYDPGTDSYTTLAPYTLASDDHAAAYLNGKIYRIGGCTGNPCGTNLTSSAEVYTIGSNSWAAAASYPQPVYQFAAVTVGGYIYGAGGYNSSGVTAKTYRYDPVNNAWDDAAIADLPTVSAAAASGLLNGRWILAGGGPSTGVLAWDPGSNTWLTLPPLLQAVGAAGGATVGSAFYAIGGISGSGQPTTYNQQYLEPPCAEPTPTVTSTPLLSTPTPSVSATLPPSATSTPPLSTLTPNASATLPPSATHTPVPNTPTPSASATPPPGTTSTPPVSTPTRPPTHTPTNTPVPTAPPSATRTALPATGTPPRSTPTPPGPPSATATPCTLAFSDVHPTDYFYGPVLYLACHGVVSGYADGTFRPYNQTTRAQMVKIVVLGFQQPIATPSGGAHTFADVPPTFPIFAVIETAATNQIVSGYACGGLGELCDGQHRPYFRPYANVTRGQLSKITVGAAGWTLQDPSSGSFTDVLPGSAFYVFVETAACHNIVSGYSCGGVGEPCDPQRRPYFRPANPATRGQIAKIVYGAISSPVSCASGAAPR